MPLGAALLRAFKKEREKTYMITIIDYGMGNLHSVKNSLDFLGIENKISGDLDEIKNANALILPGVGAFPDAMRTLEEKGIAEIIKEKCNAGTPLFGICLGMQLLVDSSEEVTFTKGLGLIPGKCVRISDTGLKIPHMGWNDLTVDRPDCPVLSNTKNGNYVYFVHSYKVVLDKQHENLAAHTMYGELIPAVITNGKNVFGAQFHPEKSEKIGLDMLKAFADFCKESC